MWIFALPRLNIEMIDADNKSEKDFLLFFIAKVTC
jgi:hypothetical protein